MRRPQSSAHGEKGFALFLSMLLLLILTVLGIALLFTATTEQSLSGNETKVSKVFYAACSGVDYATAKLSSDNNFVGGQMPVGVSSHYPGLSGDIDVTVSRPINVGYTIHPGDQIESHGTSYGTTQIVENFYFLTSTAQGSAIQAAKMITADIGVYPQQLRIPQ
ncbi:MAG: PilX N-terminal domain-containing pilus assembly protein [Acidobacteriota bacterium]|nr:PilX N-terminal domain-containing pilus assembly protein [Acidobacteriota bacterium]MDQ5871562.1 PilX N-terminal domain-containing pilus assembly protein [Acidobacteriota bacterium]